MQVRSSSYIVCEATCHFWAHTMQPGTSEHGTTEHRRNSGTLTEQRNTAGKTKFVIFKPKSYYFEETVRFDVKASFESRSGSRLIR